MRVHFNTNFNPPQKELVDFVDSLHIDRKKIFVISSCDKGIKTRWGAEGIGKYFDDFITFNVSEESDNIIGIPHLCPIHKPIPNIKKKYLASFMGNSCTHPIRKEMIEKLKNRCGVFIYDTSAVDCRNLEELIFVKNIQESYLSLCPRGTGINTFRFFESMQLGTVPIHIGDKDCRPFRDEINWNEFSYWYNNIEDLLIFLDNLKTRSQLLQLVRKGELAKEFYNENLALQQWGKYVIHKLEKIKGNWK